MVPVAPIITDIIFVLHSILAVFILYGLYILESSQLLSLSHFCPPAIAACSNINVPFFVFTAYDARFIVRAGSVGFHLLIRSSIVTLFSGLVSTNFCV
jgi:hypothetical protein